MRQLILALLTFSVFSQAYAFKDIVVIDETRKLIQALPEMSSGMRARQVEEYKDFLFKYLNETLPVPTTPEEDDEFASIQEFSGYVNQIDTKDINKAKCDATHRDIVATTNTGGQETPESKIAIHILHALCK